MRLRRHHNNSGRRQIARGKTAQQIKRIAARLRIHFAPAQEFHMEQTNVQFNRVNEVDSRNLKS